MSYGTQEGYYTVGELGDEGIVAKIAEYKWYLLGVALLAGGVYYWRKRSAAATDGLNDCGCDL